MFEKDCISHLNDTIYYDPEANCFRSKSIEPVIRDSWYLMDNQEYLNMIDKRNKGYEIYPDNGKPKLREILVSSEQLFSVIRYRINLLLDSKAIDLGFQSFTDAASYNRDEFEEEKSEKVKPLMFWRSKLNKFIKEFDISKLKSYQDINTSLNNLPEYTDDITC